MHVQQQCIIGRKVIDCPIISGMLYMYSPVHHVRVFMAIMVATSQEPLTMYYLIFETGVGISAHCVRTHTNMLDGFITRILRIVPPFCIRE